MLVRVVGPNFVAGIVFGEDGLVARAAPILCRGPNAWVRVGMTFSQVESEIHRRRLQGVLVRTLKREEIECSTAHKP